MMDDSSKIGRREFVVSTGVAVGAVAAGCGDDAPAVDGGMPDDAAVADAVVVDAGPPPAVELPPEPWLPELAAPPYAAGYVDGNVVFQVVSHQGGGRTARWVGSLGRQLQVTVGTAASDKVVLSLPNDRREVDVLGFIQGRLQHDVRTQLGDSVLMNAVFRANVSLFV